METSPSRHPSAQYVLYRGQFRHGSPGKDAPGLSTHKQFCGYR